MSGLYSLYACIVLSTYMFLESSQPDISHCYPSPATGPSRGQLDSALDPGGVGIQVVLMAWALVGDL